jgi:hypothetical protein
MKNREAKKGKEEDFLFFFMKKITARKTHYGGIHFTQQPPT